MSQHPCLIAFGTFGNPNGFKQTFFIGGNAELVKNIKTFDLKTDAIRLFPKSKIYAVRKELINDNRAVSYSIYTYAKEQNSDRGGTFIGSSILYLNCIADESNTISCLNEFHDKLVSKNVQNDVIGVTHSDQFVVSKPGNYEKLESQVKEIEDLNFSRSSNKNLVVYSEVSADKLQYLFKQAISLLDVYDVVYFTSGKEVAEFVHQKKLFQLVQTDGFGQEIAKLQEERKQHILSLTAEYETEKQKLAEDKKRVLAELKEQIDANEKIHQANRSKLDESKQEFSDVSQKYEGYGKKIEDAIHQLASGKKPDRIRQLLNENKRIFIDSVNEQKQPVFVNALSQPKAKIEIKPGFQADTFKTEPGSSNHSRRKHQEYRLDTFKIVSFVLLLLLIGTIVYFLFFAQKEIIFAEPPKQEMQTPVVVQPAPAPKPIIPELNPKPNTKLTGIAFRTVVLNLNPHASADEVVNVIFNNNTETIKKLYADQKEAYKKYLIEQNTTYFEKKDSSFYLKNDTLSTIPGYKK